LDVIHRDPAPTAAFLITELQVITLACREGIHPREIVPAIFSTTWILEALQYVPSYIINQHDAQVTRTINTRRGYADSSRRLA
jgi:hypothetical protein